MTKAGDVFKQCERTFVDLIELDKFKVPVNDKPFLTNHFAFEVVRNIPFQIEKFFELQRFDLDVTQRLIDSPKHTVLSLSDQSSEPSRTPKHGEKRDSLLILDEETANNISKAVSNSID